MPTLNWIGKQAVVNHHENVPVRLLKPVAEFSVCSPGSGNLLVEGDNLLALKALLPYYAGQVKCIYIDPPYNTGNEGWIYNDAVNAPEIQKWLHKTVGKEAEDLTRHDKWLCMMYPRLQLLKQFLRDDGFIFVSIGDDENANLRFIMDEVFRTSNFVADIVWQARQSVSSDALISLSHNHTIVYAANKQLTDAQKSKFRLPMDVEKFSNSDDDKRGAWTADPFDAPNIRENLTYPITNPNTGKIYLPPKGRCWRTTQDEYNRLMDEKRILFGKKGITGPQYKRFLSEVEEKGDASTTWWDNAGTTTEGTKTLESVLGYKAFNNPKPVRLIKRILQLATDKDAIVMDSFAGSGTTGHAVMQLNQEDGGNRRFILVEMEPNIARNVTAERLRRVICGVPARVVPVEASIAPDPAAPVPMFNENEETDTPATMPQAAPGLGGGFQYLTLGDTLFTEDGELAPDLAFQDLARHLFYTETGHPLPDTAAPTPPLIGVAGDTAVYLLWDGRESLMLDAAALRALPAHDGPRVVYAACHRLSQPRLEAERIQFRQFPYEVKLS